MFIYFFILRIAALFSPKARQLVRGQKGLLNELKTKINPDEKYVWFHAASVGEFEQGRQLIERLKSDNPSTRVLLTFFSPSGYEFRKNYQGADVVAYLPFATRIKAKKFLDIVRPEKAVFIKYEFWPAYLRQLSSRGIETYLVSAIFRPNQLFFHWYGAAYRKLLNCFTHMFVQDEASKDLLGQYGMENVTVAGDTRFDRVSNIAAQAKELPPIACFSQPNSFLPMAEKPKIIVAGSTWPADEKLLARYYAEHPWVKLILVPHEVDEAHMHVIMNLFQGRFVRLSEATRESLSLAHCLVVDKVGMLSSIYRYGDVAYIGGGFGVGIHNTLEAAVYGMPVVFGPNYKNFREARNLIANGGGFSIKNYQQLCNIFDQLLESSEEAGKAALEYVNSELGATDKIYKAIFYGN